MEQTVTPKLLAFRGVISEIITETELMKKLMLSDEEEKEENEILCRFKDVVEKQVFSTIVKLAIYQLREWRELIDE